MPERDGRVSRIVAGVDGSPAALAALRWAVRQAALTGASVDAVIAWQYPMVTSGYAWAPVAMVEPADYEEIAEKIVTDAISSVVDPGSHVHARAVVQQGTTAQVLIDAAAGADMLVVGSRGHGGFAGALLGSVSQHCVHHAPCPVAVIRAGLDRAGKSGA
jgi:nucleotide-binding universal stress UspA family protein